jgi:hypothetical protein
MNKQGFIALSRGLPDHPIVGLKGKFKPSEAWLWLLLEAAWKPRRVGFQAGRHHGTISLERGQLSHSLRFIASKWGWSVKRTTTFLVALETDHMITTQTDTGQTLITICNYSTYQAAASSEETQTRTQRKRNGNKEEEGNKEIRERDCSLEPDGFEEWYSAYPRKKQRKDAARAYRRVVPKEITHADLLARTIAFAEFHDKNTAADRLQFVPYPATWLNKGEYLDQPRNSGAEQGDIKLEPPTRDPKTFTDAEWSQRLTDFGSGQPWPDLYWGPAPGQPGCLVPARLLIDEAVPVAGRWDRSARAGGIRAGLGEAR